MEQFSCNIGLERLDGFGMHVRVQLPIVQNGGFGVGEGPEQEQIAAGG